MGFAKKQLHHDWLAQSLGVQIPLVPQVEVVETPIVLPKISSNHDTLTFTGPLVKQSPAKFLPKKACTTVDKFRKNR